MPIVKIKNAQFYYELHGSGQPLVLIAGYSCDHTFWVPVLEGLSRVFQVCIFDNRGVGRTLDDNVPLTAQLMAADVISLCDHLELNQPHIVGQSMGGTIAQTIGALYSEKIKKLCILNSTVKWRTAMLLAQKMSLEMRGQEFDFDFIFENMLPWLFGEKFLQNEKQIAQFKKSILDNRYPQSLKNQERQFEVLAHFDGRENLAKIKNKTLIGYGREDLLALPIESLAMVEKMSDASLLSIDCAHVSVLEAPKTIVEALLEFLR